MANHDLVIKGGTVVDPSQGIHEEMDVAVLGGKIAEVRRGLAASNARQVIDASGELVTPGLVDLHVHAYDAVMPLGIDPDLHCLAKGTTAVLDAGSSGCLNFPGLRKHVINRCTTKVYALLNIGSIGLMTYGSIMEALHEDPRHISVADAVKTIEDNRECLHGIKWHNTFGPRALVAARTVADKAGCRLMCENSALFWMPVSHILDFMKPGDILTHVFQGGPAPTVLDPGGQIRPELLGAARRGIVMDVGHGAASFSFDVAEKAIGQGFLPDVISTDLHTGNLNGPVFDLPTTLSKFLMLGLSVDEALLRATHNPAKSIGLDDRLGSLKEGFEADVVTLRVENGRFTFEDSLGQRRLGNERLLSSTVVARGRVVKRL